MKRLFLMMAILPLLTAGCTSEMWQSGFATVTTTRETYKVGGNQPPVATKDTNGSVVIEFDAVRYRLDIRGGTPDQSEWTLQRITNTVSLRELKPITNLFARNLQGFICPPSSNEEAFVAAGQLLPSIDLKWMSNGAILYPPSECLLNEAGWVWYVPPHHTGEPGRGALLSKETTKNSRAYIPAKIALTPLTLAEDVFVVPAWGLLFLIFAVGHTIV